MEGTVERLRTFLQEGGRHLVVTADATAIAKAQHDDAFQRMFREASLVTADSAGVVWALRRKGKAVPGRVSGVDLLARLCEESANRGTRLFFLGGAPGIAETAAERLRLRYPGCNIVGVRHGYFPSESDGVVAAEIAAAKPDVLFVGMGMPRQELFFLNHPEIEAKIGIGVGGSFDVFSGKIRRAPRLVQRMHLEWFWRLLQDPRKIGKVKVLPKFVWLVLTRDR
jgi:N-acetylglucosaminyldiphosphoundecaprenol N-acetyl-beta-D-mannosaminyltransferase